jgi:hypothetical protein
MPNKEEVPHIQANGPEVEEGALGREWVFDPVEIEGDPSAGVGEGLPPDARGGLPEVPPRPDGRHAPPYRGRAVQADYRTTEEKMEAEREFDRQQREAEAAKYIPPEDHKHLPENENEVVP